MWYHRGYRFIFLVKIWGSIAGIFAEVEEKVLGLAWSYSYHKKKGYEFSAVDRTTRFSLIIDGQQHATCSIESLQRKVRGA
jgi:hypothetical protein